MCPRQVFVPAPHSISGARAQPDGSVLLTFAGETTAGFAQYYDQYPMETPLGSRMTSLHLRASQSRLMVEGIVNEIG